MFVVIVHLIKLVLRLCNALLPSLALAAGKQSRPRNKGLSDI